MNSESEGPPDTEVDPPTLSVSEKADVLGRVAAAINARGLEAGRAELVASYPFVTVEKTPRRYIKRQLLKVYYRDGFVDRYSRERLVHPGVLRVLASHFPEEFPAHPNWAMAKTHFAFWELFPSLDHVVPVSRGGADDASNWVTTSMLRNSAKAHWTLEELGWQLHPPGDYRDWDGLSEWFVDHVSAHPELRVSPYISQWWSATVEVRASLN